MGNAKRMILLCTFAGALVLASFAPMRSQHHRMAVAHRREAAPRSGSG